ncbi:winged helix DNA-binding domain-containing protein [Deinococcus taeanensis]|uniref:DNA glycosylase AlkZ-like family protein n=1 Tax=Deinococcus taeanensis TaxID=2737050 RepID=UPI001CDCAEFE|nr:crosslink repair DNA glycosylase YcaQ family protein [Deinococcus taeanensis]UBV43911.1 winged helix DNA-binding domain-containing protein [Deinococcus taeanensis]
MTPDPTLAALRAAAYRTLIPERSVQAALNRMGFVQADPIRAPARAQDLALLARVRGYRAGDLERLYPTLDAEEDVIPNYGFVTRGVQRLLHPRVTATRAERDHPQLLARVRDLLRERGELHPRDVTAALGQTRVVNAWGGQSNATTRVLDALHYRGEARVVRREAGVRVYGPAPHLDQYRQAPLPDPERVRGVVHLLAALYGPLPEASLGYLVGLSRYGLPHLRPRLRAAFRAAVREDLRGAQVEGVRYVWPADWALDSLPVPRGVRIVNPFDPLVWDRRRFEHLHGWAYRFEAYTPPARRTMGYYALPLFRAERAVGWVTMSVHHGTLQAHVGLRPGGRITARFTGALERELERYRVFLSADQVQWAWAASASSQT